METGQPVPCTDDDVQHPPFQTGQQVPVADFQQQEPALQDLQTDAMLDSTRPSASRQVPAAHQDHIKITAPEGGTIEATNVVAALGPGTHLQLAVNNHMTLYSGGQSSSHRKQAPIPNKLPVTSNISAPATRDHFKIVSSGIVGEWRRLGRELKLDESVLEHIYMDYNREKHYEITYQVLMKWSKTFQSATVHTLALALIEIGRGDLADALHERG